MIVVPCPNCGPRNSSDLRNCGEVVERPNPEVSTIEEWRSYLYLKKNTADWMRETWYCRNGCRKYFVVERNTATNEIRESRP